MNFSDADFKTSSKAILDAPLEIENANAAKADAAVAKADFLNKDNTNKLFFDNVLQIITSYHDELKGLNGVVRTTYDPTLLDDAAQLKSGNLHLGGSWTNFVPKIHASMNGNPISAVSDHEAYRLPRLTDAIQMLKTGWADGSLSGTVDNWNGGTTLSGVSVSFPVGHRLAIYGAGNSGVAKVISVTTVNDPGNPSAVPPVPPSTSYTLNLEVLAAPSGSVGEMATIRNYFEGFTDAVRTSGISATYQDILDGLKQYIVVERDALKGFINTQKQALEANTATGTEKIDNDGAIAQAESALENFDDWDAMSATGVGGRWTDLGLQILSTTIFNRTNHLSEREPEIVQALGNVSQATGGDYSGVGQYFSLAKWINLRINLANGTLRNYYDTDQIDRFFNEAIRIATDKKAEFENFMLVYQMKAGSGGNLAVVDDPTGLSVGDAVKLMDDDAPITDANILNIQGQSVTLSAPISGYSLDKVARLVKPL